MFQLAKNSKAAGEERVWAEWRKKMAASRGKSAQRASMKQALIRRLLLSIKDKAGVSNKYLFNMKYLLVILSTTVLLAEALAQQPLNLGFETKSAEGKVRPWGWAQYQVVPQTTTMLDSTTTREGRFSLRVFNENTNDDGSGGVHTLAYWMSPHELRGKQLNLTGWVKTEKNSGAALITVFAICDTGWVEQARSQEFRGNNDWQKMDLAFRASEDPSVHSFYIFIGVEGSGKAWLDDFRLAVGGHAKNSVEVATDFTQEQRLWLNKNTSTMGSYLPVALGERSDFSDLEAFRKSVGDAEIIALGEATHGTSEFFQLKHRLLQFSVQELGVRVFAIEANQLEVEKINRFVCDGVGKAEEVIRVMFKVWNTEEMLALIKWMRAYNLENPSSKVEFVGFDLQDPSLPMDSLSSFVAVWEPSLRPLVDSLQRSYREAWRAQYYPQADDEVRAGWKTNANQVLALLVAQKENWISQTTTKPKKMMVEWALQNARVVSQAADIAYSQKVSGRDTFMAENIRWIQQVRGEGTRIVVWAHDSHIARSDHPNSSYNYHFGDSMGKYLSKRYGDRYRAYGLFTAAGQYSATISFTNHQVVPVDAMNAPRGSFDEVLHQLAKQRSAQVLLLDLQPTHALRDNGWLVQPRPVRFVGYASADFDFGAVMSVPYQFDGLFFVDSTKASKMLR